MYLEEKRWTFLREFESMLVQFETEYNKLKEATTLLELALWKAKMNDKCHEKEGSKKKKKKIKIDESEIRE